MAKWIRTLGASGQWHVLAGDKEFLIPNALCGERFPGALEVVHTEERTVRDGRCSTCEARLKAKEQEAAAAAAQHHARY